MTNQPLAAWYIATEVFRKSDDSDWQGFLKFSNLNHLEEVVGLDSCLSPSVVNAESNEDFENSVVIDKVFQNGFYSDLEYLKLKLSAHEQYNLLKVYLNPDESTAKEQGDGFVFKGFDLIEEGGTISALTNCGGFPESFSSGDLNKCGLIDDYSKAISIRENLKMNNPNEGHAYTDLFAIFRYE